MPRRSSDGRGWRISSWSAPGGSPAAGPKPRPTWFNEQSQPQGRISTQLLIETTGGQQRSAGTVHFKGQMSESWGRVRAVSSAIQASRQTSRRPRRALRNLLRVSRRAEEQLYSIRRPCGNACSEKIVVFGPDRGIERERRCQNRPIVGIPACQARSGRRLK